ncbi:MAG: hypothetical protein FWE63_08820 [Bacteroidales bacterium]|nr:hypothetical protein [Bacteroidales bacterium]
MKTHMLATSPSLGDGLLHSRGFNILVAQFEICFGIWLLVGLMPKLTYLMSLGCFAIFAGVSFYKAFVLQETSCGCWGTAQVSPYLTMAFDLAVIGLLIVFRPKGIVFHWKAFLYELAELKRFRRVCVVAVAWLLLAVPATYAMTSVEKNDLAELGTEFIGADGKKTILLAPEKWLGKSLPLLPYIEPPEVREKLKTGEWTVVLYHHDCPKCKEVIDELIEKKTENLVCVEVPPLGTSLMTFPNVVNSSIIMKQQIFVETPVVLSLVNGFARNSENPDRRSYSGY